MACHVQTAPTITLCFRFPDRQLAQIPRKSQRKIAGDAAVCSGLAAHPANLAGYSIHSRRLLSIQQRYLLHDTV